jgi:hypothetical protein
MRRRRGSWLLSRVGLARLHLTYFAFDTGLEDVSPPPPPCGLFPKIQIRVVACLSRFVVCNVGATGAVGVGNSGTRQCSSAAAVVLPGFAHADHKKTATKKTASGGDCLLTGRHKDVCAILRKWREVGKDGVTPDSCTVDLVASLQR